jgi:hypothetical protein
MACQRQSWVNCRVCVAGRAVPSQGSVCKSCRAKTAHREIQESDDVAGALAALAKFEKATKPASGPLTQASLF